MLIVPLSAVPSQKLSCVLSQQNCQINVYQLATGLFFDLTSADVSIIRSRIGRDADLLLDEDYLGFVGNFAFIDTQGSDDPVWTGLGARWQLIYYEAADL